MRLFPVIYIYKAVRVCMFGPLRRSQFFTDLAHFFCMQDLWVDKKDLGYAKLHYEAV